MEGCTALIKASYFGNTEIVKYLLNIGVDVNVPNNVSVSMLHM